MQAGKPSQSAEGVAAMRALHQLVDDDPKVLADPVALPIIGEEARRWLAGNIDRQQAPALRMIRAMVLVRARFAEDELLAAVHQGTSQYVILGAGLDTFAYRCADLAGRLTIFEVDYPATQARKRARLAEAGIVEPAHVRYVPIDFNEQSLGECLAAAGLRRDEPAFFSWLGVIYYLERKPIEETFRFIASHGSRSQVVLDFGIAESALPVGLRHVWARVNQHMARTGEPWQTWFTPDELTRELQDCGFAEVSYVAPEEASRRYLTNRKDLPQLGPFTALMSATAA